jgi:hypothetical protein
MKNLFTFITVIILGCQNPETPSKSLVDKMAELCGCQNSEGKTIEIHAREVLGQDFYLMVNTVEAFSEKLKSHPDEFAKLTQTIENQFLKDGKYAKCAKQFLKSINADIKRGAAKDEAPVLNFFNEKKEFTVYRMLPFMITYFEQSE